MVAFDPAKFRIGDIVEAQLSFIAVHVRNKYRLRVILRSLARLNNKHSEVWFVTYSDARCADYIIGGSYDQESTRHRESIERYTGLSCQDIETTGGLLHT